jgi:ubiquinone/menaquinone biosynthesis C-methylase UbiE
MWWFAALHANLIAAYRLVRPEVTAGRMLDAGCGTGGLLGKLAQTFPHAALVGLDADENACQRARSKSRRAVCAGSVNELPFAGGGCEAIFSADVLCHAGVDEDRTLAEFRRVLRPGGILVLNLPAYRWMLSRHDVAVANVRRYTRGGTATMLSRAGFRLLYSSYWNAALFPLMVLTRKLLPGGGSDVSLYPAPIEAACRAAMRGEQALMRAGLRFWFGGSVLAVAAKEESSYG